MSLLHNGLAKSTRTYSTAQRRFMEICYWSGYFHENGSPLLTSEWTLILFVTELSRSLVATTIKVYCQGFKNPLIECTRLKQLLRGIKRVKGVAIRPRLPITASILRRVQPLLLLHTYHDSMFWVACSTFSRNFGK